LLRRPCGRAAALTDAACAVAGIGTGTSLATAPGGASSWTRAGLFPGMTARSLESVWTDEVNEARPAARAWRPAAPGLPCAGMKRPATSGRRLACGSALPGRLSGRLVAGCLARPGQPGVEPSIRLLGRPTVAGQCRQALGSLSFPLSRLAGSGPRTAGAVAAGAGGADLLDRPAAHCCLPADRMLGGLHRALACLRRSTCNRAAR
jgi:hypothetical protein